MTIVQIWKHCKDNFMGIILKFKIKISIKKFTQKGKPK